VRAGDATLAELQCHFPPRQVIKIIITARCCRVLCMLLETTDVDIEANGCACSPVALRNMLRERFWRFIVYSRDIAASARNCPGNLAAGSEVDDSWPA